MLSFHSSIIESYNLNKIPSRCLAWKASWYQCSGQGTG